VEKELTSTSVNQAHISTHHFTFSRM